ncbi:MAG: hypothetical protein KKG04_08205, partial [Candidatus Thermoplasmatota archaeon]|nr:hypothetical protein [Candidatus Thermoplasmatota archaeon]
MTVKIISLYVGGGILLLAVTTALTSDRLYFYFAQYAYIALMSLAAIIIHVSPKLREKIKAYTSNHFRRKKIYRLQLILTYTATITAALLFFLILINHLQLELSQHIGYLYSISITQALFLIATLNLLLISPDKKRKNDDSNEKKNSVFLLYIRNNKHILFLTFAIISAFVIRIWRLDYLSPATDEYAHIIAAQHFLQDGLFYYKRGAITSYGTAFFIYLFGDANKLYLSRLTSVFFGALSVIPIFYLSKRISPYVAYMSVLLWIISPFAIGYARYARMYSSYSLIYIFYFLITLLLCDQMKKEIWSKKTALLSVILSTVLLLNITLFKATADFKGVYLAIAIPATYLIFLTIKRILESSIIKPYKAVTVIIFSCAIVIGAKLVIFSSDVSSFFTNKISFNSFYTDLFFSSGIADPAKAWQWFSGLPLHILFFITLSIGGTLYYYKNNTTRFIFWTFILGLLFTCLTINKNISRVAFFLLPFFTIISATGIIMLVKSVRQTNKWLNFVSTIIVSFLLLTIYSPLTSIATIMNEQEMTVDTKTGIDHLDNFSVIDYLKNNTDFNSKHTLITSNTLLFAYSYNYPFLSYEKEYPNHVFRYSPYTNKWLYD